MILYKLILVLRNKMSYYCKECKCTHHKYRSYHKKSKIFEAHYPTEEEIIE